MQIRILVFILLGISAAPAFAQAKPAEIQADKYIECAMNAKTIVDVFGLLGIGQERAKAEEFATRVNGLSYKAIALTSKDYFFEKSMSISLDKMGVLLEIIEKNGHKNQREEFKKH